MNYKPLVYLQHPCRLRLFSRLRATLVVVGSLATVPLGDRFLSPIPNGQGSYKRERGREVRLFIGWNFFFSLNVLSVWVPGHNSAPRVSLCFYNHNSGMLLHIMGVRSTSSFLHLDIVLSSVITFCIFCHIDGWLLHKIYPVNVMHSFKFIRTLNRFT